MSPTTTSSPFRWTTMPRQIWTLLVRRAFDPTMLRAEVRPRSWNWPAISSCGKTWPSVPRPFPVSSAGICNISPNAVSVGGTVSSRPGGPRRPSTLMPSPKLARRKPARTDCPSWLFCVPRRVFSSSRGIRWLFLFELFLCMNIFLWLCLLLKYDSLSYYTMLASHILTRWTSIKKQ